MSKEAVDACCPLLRFVPDCFVTDKMLDNAVFLMTT